MGVEYYLINDNKQEIISFVHLQGSKFNELLVNHPQSAIVTLYMLNNQGDTIRFIPDQSGDDWSNEFSYTDVTQQYIDELIQKGVFSNDGYLYQDEDDLNAYVLNLRCNYS